MTKVLDGCVIREEFDGRPGTPLLGLSLSCYVVAEGRRKQRWVDNAGNYYDFTGGMERGRMVLTRETTVEGRPALHRMVWCDIEPDELKLNWEISFDDGDNWELRW